MSDEARCDYHWHEDTIAELRADIAKLTAEAGRMRAWFRKAKDEYLKDGNLSGRLQREADEWSALSPAPSAPKPGDKEDAHGA